MHSTKYDMKKCKKNVFGQATMSAAELCEGYGMFANMPLGCIMRPAAAIGLYL